MAILLAVITLEGHFTDGLGAEGEIRLVNGNATAGRVEIYLNDVWGTICDDSWGIEDAGIVCRQLGLGPALSAPGSASFGEGQGLTQMDDVSCSGTETRLTECSFTDSLKENCGHNEDAGVVCAEYEPGTKGAIRLVNGNATAGRVEIYLNGAWGTVCDDSWSIEDARIVCRQLRLGPALSAPGSAFFGRGEGITQMDDVDCSGEESRLVECSFTDSYKENCKHSEDAGVVCAEYEPGIEGYIRLVNGNETAGRVEIFLNGFWGTVCDDYWDTQDARVACRQLGLGGPVNAKGRAFFGQGKGLIHMDDVFCAGNEFALSGCSFTGLSGENCGHHEDAGVVCSGIDEPGTEGEVRLVNGNATAGRVEIYLNGVWGTVCDDFWGISDARVVCRQLGLGPALSAPGSAFFGEGQDPTQMDDVSCSGTESRLTECSFADSLKENCGHNEDAGVVCAEYEPGIEGYIRLVNGNNTAGRVEIFLNGVWGTVCDDNWDIEDARVVCRQLGLGGPLNAPGSAFFGEGQGLIQMDDVFCVGNEFGLSDCPFSGMSGENCRHHEDAGVVCSGIDEPGFEGEVRLMNGNATAGRVEIHLNGLWGTVCDDSWEMKDASVVCRQLGLGSALSAPGNAFFGEGKGLTQMDDVDCSGDESRLADCTSSLEENCQHSEDAGVVCAEYEPGTEGYIRLVNGNETAGRVEIFLNGLWGTVCDDAWDIEDARVVCRQLGLGVPFSAPGNAFFGEGQGLTQMDNVACVGSEFGLSGCTFTGLSKENCGHHEDAGVVCSMIDEPGVEGYIRLVNGNETAGRVEIFLNGEWGTVCDDRWDIEDAWVACQQLGLGTPLSAQRSAFFGARRGLIQMDDVECSGNEFGLSGCSFTGSSGQNCGHGEDAGVICSLDDRPGVEGEVRLVRGNATAGRVEIYLNDVWGTVCDDSWDIVDANIVCRQLGFGQALSALGGAFFAEGRGAIKMDDVVCSGEENRLVECSFTESFEENCSHSEDAGVVCSGADK